MAKKLFLGVVTLVGFLMVLSFNPNWSQGGTEVMRDDTVLGSVGGSESVKLCLTVSQACPPAGVQVPPVGEECENAATREVCTPSPNKNCVTATGNQDQCDAAGNFDCPADVYFCKVDAEAKFYWAAAEPGTCDKQRVNCLLNGDQLP